MQALNEMQMRAISGGYYKHVSKWISVYMGEKFYMTNPTGWMYFQDYDQSREPYAYLYAGYLEY